MSATSLLYFSGIFIVLTNPYLSAIVSLFLINSRENNLVTAKLSQIALENRYFVSNSELFKIMANPD